VKTLDAVARETPAARATASSVTAERETASTRVGSRPRRTPAVKRDLTALPAPAACNVRGVGDPSRPAYISKVRIVRERGPIREAFLPSEEQPVIFGTHGPVREHYGTAPGQYPEHATTLDYVVAATAG